MTELLSALSRALAASPAVALFAAFLWGLASLVLSPCHLASIPLVVGFVGREQDPSTRRALLLSSLFAAGILITLAAAAAAASALGLLLGDLGRVGGYAVAAVLLAFGLHLLDVLPLPLPSPGSPSARRKGPLAALALGLVYGLALGPCTFAFLAPVLALALRVAGADPLRGGLLLLAYGVGHCSVIVVAGTSTRLVQRALRWNEGARAALFARRTCAALLILAGLYQVWTA